MAKPTFTEELLRLSNQIVTEEDLDCLRFIVTSKVGPDQHGKDAKGMFDHLVKEKFLSQNNIDILYEALTLMGRILLRSKFLKNIGYRESYKPKRSVISAFTRMLIKVRHTLTVTGTELGNLVYCYKNSEIGAGIVTCENSAYAVLQYLLDKVLVANDKESLDTFARFLGAATCVQGKQHVLKYLKDNPDLHQRAALQSTQEDLRHVNDDALDSADGGPGANIAGSDNVVVIGAQNVTINRITRQQQEPTQQPATSQQPPTGQQQATGQQPPTSQQLPMGQQPLTSQQLPMGQQPLTSQQLPMGQQPPTSQQLPMGQQPSTIQKTQQPRQPRQDVLPLEMSLPKTQPSLSPSRQTIPPEDRPTPTDQSAMETNCGSSEAYQAHYNRLKQNITSLNMRIRKDVAGDGNCFFYCIQDQLERLGLSVESVATMRTKLVEFLRNLDEDDPLKTHVGEDYLERLEKDGTWVDAVAVRGMSRVLNRNIRIVTSQKESIEEGYLVNEIKENSNSEDQLLLGLIGESHYISLDSAGAIGQDSGEQQQSRDQNSLDFGIPLPPVVIPDTRASTQPTDMSSPKPLSSLSPSSQPTSPDPQPPPPPPPPDDDRPTSTDQSVCQQGRWCEEKKCFRFSQDEIKKMKRVNIGEGGFGIVHKGYWIQNAKPNVLPVAIKEYNEENAMVSGQGDKQFEKELDAVAISKHCFVVTVLGYCREGEYKAILYPYMEKGDLKRLLDNNDPALTWEIRLRILYQICRAMCHFHNSFRSRVGELAVHGDVKADNIFLDKHLNACLGDFGVMVSLPEGRTSITQTEKPSVLGYKDPDAVKRLSMSSDVYMFGVVIFRCLTSEAAQKEDDAPECESLAPKKRSHINESCEELYERVDRNIWKHDDLVKELADLAIKCFIRKKNKAVRCTFKEILRKLDNLMKKENIPAYIHEENADTICICCQLNPPIECLNSECGCPSVVCSVCLQNKDLPCPFHVSSRIRDNLSE